MTAPPVAEREPPTPPRAVAAEPERVLTTVPRPDGDTAVVALDHTAGGLAAVRAEWGVGGGDVVLTGRVPFADVTGHAGFRTDGTLDGTVRMRARVGFLGLDLGEATWTVDGWDPATPLTAPAVTLRGGTLDVDLGTLPEGAAWSAREGVTGAREGNRATVDLPAGAAEPGQPLSPRLAEVYRGLGLDVSGLRVHPDSQVAGAPAFVTDADLFFAPGIYGVDSTGTLRILDAAVRAALTGLAGPVAGPPPEVVPPAPVTEPAPAADTSPIPANVPETPAVETPAVAEEVPPATAETAAPQEEPATPETAPEEGEAEAPPPVELIMPEPPSTLTPPAAARGGGVARAAGGAATAARDLPSADANVADSRGAVTEPVAETAARAREELAAALGERPAPSPEIVELCERIRTAIKEKRPEDEDELLETDPTQEAQQAGATITGSVEGQVQQVGDAYDEMASPPAGTPALTPTPIDQPNPGSPGLGVDAAGAAPDPIPPENTTLDADVAATDQRIADSGIDTRVTKEIPDGPFAEARAARAELGAVAEKTPGQIQAEQQQAIDTAQADMAQLQLQAVAAMRAARSGTVGAVGTNQTGMVTTEEQTRESVSARAQKIYDDTQKQVDDLLRPLSQTAIARWEAGLARLSQEFHDALDRVKKWIDERHSGVGGAIVAVGDYIAGLPDWVTEEYDRAETQFGDGVVTLLTDISSDVNGVIAAARALIQHARTDIDAAFTAMEAEFPEWAAQERAKFSGMLDGLDQRVTAAQTSFVRDVSQRAITAVNEVHAEAQALRDEAGGLIGRVAAAIEEFIEDPVRAIINGLLRLVGIPPAAFWALIAKIEQVISDIADDPESFVNNLVAGVKQGFTQFFDNFGTHLLRGFWDWLFSGLETPIPMPRDLSPGSLFSFALQLMGVTWAKVREILVRHVGPTATDVIEAAWRIISVLVERGPQGLVDMVKEQLSPENIVGMILDAAIEYLVETLIKQVAIRVVGLLNPAGAIAQAIDLIYQVCSWIFRNAARLFRFVEAVVNGMADVVAGNVGGLARAVETALASLLPPVIDFLAGLLHLGGLPNEVAAVIVRLQTAVYAVLDRVIGFLAQQAKALLRRLGIGGEEKPDEDEGNGDEELGTTVRFSAAGESHRVWFDVAGEDATLMVASVPQPIADKIAEWRGQLDEVPEEERPAATAKLDNLAAVADDTNAKGDELAKQFLDAARDPDDETKPPDDSAVETRERAIAGMLSELFAIFDDKARTATWLADMAKFLPREGDLAMDPPYRDWALRMPEFTIGNEPQDPRIWPPGTLDGTRGDAVAYISTEATHRLLLPYFQTAKGSKKVATDAFSDYVFVEDQSHSVRRHFRNRYGNAAVAKLQTTAAETVAAYQRVDDKYKEQLLRRVGKMTFEWDSPGGGRILFPVEKTPDHTRYRPLDIKETEANGVRTVKYNTVTGQQFTATIDSNNGLSMSVTGVDLRYMTGRGVTEDSPAYTVNNGFDRSHIIANEFGGSGFAAGANLVTASEHYNQKVMRGAERTIGTRIRAVAEQHGKDETEVSFTMTVTVSFGALRDPQALAEAKQLPGFPADRAGTDLDAEILQKINAGQVHADLLRITGVLYQWTFTDPAAGGGNLSIGPDLWLLTFG